MKADRPERQARRRTILAVAVALLAGIVVLVLLFPGSGVDTDPPECHSVFGYVVPCEARIAWAAAAVVAVAAGAAFWWLGRRSRPW